jgi:hypothetical protein
MSVFICWSGARSHAIAKALEKLLQANGVSEASLSDDIEKGTVWFASILKKLGKAQAGIVCLTPENRQSPWIHFEAGALAGAVAEPASHDSALFTLLHGVNPAEISGPLSAYQATRTTKEDAGRLVRSIQSIRHDAQGRKEKRPANDGIEKLDEFMEALGKTTLLVSDLIRDLGQLFQRKTFNEPLDDCTDQNWRARYDGARLTHETLRVRRDQVKAACSADQFQLFQELLTALDGYAMATDSMLFTSQRFGFEDSGKLHLPKGILTGCEVRRLAVNSLVARLTGEAARPLDHLPDGR